MQKLEDIICEKMVEWSYGKSTNAFYNEPALLLHKRMWDIMRRDKEGLAKERTFTHWCRRVHEHTKAASTASGSTAYESLAVDLLANDLTPEQRHDATYKKRYHTETGGIIITNKQRSWISNILRKNLGDAKVAYFIFDQGLPELLKTHRPYSIFCKRMKNKIEELMRWHASLLHSILEHQNHPDMANARKLSSLDEKKWQMQRRERKLEEKKRMDQGKYLADERDSGKRKFEYMSFAEQQNLEDFYTGTIAKRHEQECGKPLPRFCGKML